MKTNLPYAAGPPGDHPIAESGNCVSGDAALARFRVINFYASCGWLVGNALFLGDFRPFSVRNQDKIEPASAFNADSRFASLPL